MKNDVTEKTIFDQLGERPQIAKLIDWTLISLDKERKIIKLSFQAIDRFTNPAGTIHGGFVTTMLDECMGSAIIGVTDASYFPTTISLNTDFIKPVPVGKIFGEGLISSMGRKIAFLEAALKNSSGQLLARATGSYKLTPFDMNWVK